MPHLEPNKTLKVVEDFKKVHEAFERINFNAYDFDTIKASLIEYLRLYFPEDFNDYIESSEIIALIETFAYVGELLAYRLDLNTHENFITQAQKKESVLRLARLISFNASRRQSARGLVRLDSVSTTEEVRDSLNNNLRNRVIKFNDPNNANWQEQFFIVMKLLLRQKFGEPQLSVIIDGVTHDRYSTKITALEKGVFPYTANTSLKNIQMELVSTDVDSTGAIEETPNPDGDFQLLFVDDGLGLGSNGTGFMILTVQGEAARNAFDFQQPIPNRAVRLPQIGLNQKDVHVIQVDSADSDTIVEIWNRVDSLEGEHLHFNPADERKNYEAITLEDDQIEIRFGDSAFATIPVGAFNIWARISEADPIIIPRSKVQEEEFSFSYPDIEKNTQQGTFRFSLVNSLANAVASQDVENIRRTAPSIYYTQNRMVNSRDYNEFLFQDPAVLKLKAVNRTFSGQTKFLDFQDSSGNFQNIKHFGDDLRLLLLEDIVAQISTSTQGATDAQIITSILEPILTLTDVKEHLRKTQGVENPRTLFREEVNASASFSFEILRIQGSSTGASGAGAGENRFRFPADGVASTFTTSAAGLFVIDGSASGDFTIINASEVDFLGASTATVFMAASIGSVPFNSAVFTPYPQPSHKQEKTDIQGRVDGRYFGTHGSTIGNFSADGLIRTVNNKNIYILDINIPASAYQNGTGVTVSSFLPQGSVVGADSAAVGVVEAIYPIPNASGVTASVFGIGAILFLTASNTAIASFTHGEFLTLNVAGSTIIGSGATGIARVLSGSTAAPNNVILNYQLQVGGSATAGACSLGQHQDTGSAIVSATGATNNDPFGIGYDNERDQYYTIAPADLGAELAPWSKANARSITASSLDDSWVIRAQKQITSGVTNWKVSYRTLDPVAQGITTDFFYQNDRLLEDSTTGLIVEDAITILGINFDVQELLAIGSNQVFPVVSQPTDTITALTDKDRLIVKNNDTNQDGVPDNLNQFDLVVDGVSPDLVLSLDGTNNDLTLVPPQQQNARDGATVYGVPRHQFTFVNGDVRWQEQFNKWGDGAFLQDFVNQSTYLTASTTGELTDFTFGASIVGSLVGDAPNAPRVLIGSAAAGNDELVEIVRGSDFEIIVGSVSGISSFNIISISAASALFDTTVGQIPASAGQVVIRQVGITLSNALPDDLMMASDASVNTTGDVPFTVETYLKMAAADASSLIIVDTFEDFSGSAGGYRLRVEGSTISFDVGGSTIKETTTITLPAIDGNLVASAEDASFFQLRSPDDAFYVWFQASDGLGAVSIDPAASTGASGTSVPVQSLVAGDSGATVATAAASSINTLTQFSASATGAILTITSASAGVVNAFASTLAAASTVQGSIIVAQSDAGDIDIILTATVSATNADMLDGEFHHIAGVFTRGMRLTNSNLTDLTVVEDGDRLVNVDNSSTAIIYDMEIVNSSNAIAWVKNISASAGASGLFGFDGCAVLRIETLGNDGAFTALTAASGLVSISAMGNYIIAFASGVPGTRVSTSALTIQNPSGSTNLEMMKGLFGSTTAVPKVYCDGISITREARYGGTFTPGRIQPQTVFFDRVDALSGYDPIVIDPTPLDIVADQDTFAPALRLIREYIGRDDLNFLWSHFTPRRNLVDPSKTNIIDMFVHTLGYQTELENWLERDDALEEQPEPPTSTDLKIAFGSFLDKAMLSDTVVLHPGIIKFLFGSRANSELRSKFRVIKKEESLVADDHLRTLVLDVIKEYFDIENWDFGRVFYFTDLAAAIHQSLPKDVQSVVLVPTEGENRFGDLFQVVPGEDEILQSSAKGSDIEIIIDITRQNIRRTEI